MIKVYCRTNLDEGKRYSWPKLMLYVPRIGERVRCIPDSGPHRLYDLRVVGITYAVEKCKEGEYGSFIDYNGNWMPIIEVELNN